MVVAAPPHPTAENPPAIAYGYVSQELRDSCNGPLLSY
jgi:hypothetical protein